MKTFIACVLVMLAVTAGAGGFTADNTLLWTTTSSEFNTFAWRNPKNTCLKFSFGDNKFSVCGLDNASKIMVDDCETIGFAHAWKVEETMIQGDGLSPGPEGTILLHSYIAKRTRRYLNCTVVEEEYNEVTPKWRRKP